MLLVTGRLAKRRGESQPPYFWKLAVRRRAKRQTDCGEVRRGREKQRARESHNNPKVLTILLASFVQHPHS